MSVFQIKVVAMIAMVIDHIGLFFFPKIVVFRIIGRVAFPLFAWLIANGARYTRNISRYVYRLFIFAFISQIPFVLVHRINEPLFWRWNVLFTLLLGLMSISVLRRIRLITFRIVGMGACLLLAYLIKPDYGVLGVISVTTFFIFYDEPVWMVLTQVFIVIVDYLYLLVVFAPIGLIDLVTMNNYYQFFTLVALIIILSYNKKEGTKMKYFFYIFFPVQYLIIYLLKII